MIRLGEASPSVILREKNQYLMLSKMLYQFIKNEVCLTAFAAIAVYKHKLHRHQK